LNHMILLVVQLADVFTLLPGLLQYGLTRGEAMQAKGVFDRGQPLIQLGAVLGSSFALALIPNLSKNKWLTQPRIMYQQIERDRKSTRLNSSHVSIPYAVLCLKKTRDNQP